VAVKKGEMASGERKMTPVDWCAGPVGGRRMAGKQ
jgi:hypothetical protein